MGGDAGETVGGVISGVIQVVVAYLCDCCLGWVFYRKEQSAAKATCEGAVLFFKHGKTLGRNLGRVFGMGIVSFVVITGVFGGIAYLVFSMFPAGFQALANEAAEAIARGDLSLPEFLTDPVVFMAAAAVITGAIIWSLVHKVFVRPFVLTGVLRNYLASGIADIPSESEFTMLDSKSKKFAKLHRQAAAA